MTSSARFVCLVLLVTVASLMLSGASGATITGVAVGVSSDPREDAPFALSVTGQSDVAAAMALYLSDAGHDCGAGHGDLAPGTDVRGPFALTVTVTMALPGPYDVCLLDGGNRWSALLVGHVAVRAAHGTAAIDAPSVAPEGGRISLTLTGTSEQPEQLYLEASGSGGCDTYNVLESDDIAADTVSGAFTRTFRVPTPDAGRLFLCAYVQESTDLFVRPIARAQATVLVSTACGRATRRVASLRTAARRAAAGRRVRLRRRLGLAERARGRACRA